MRVIHISDTHGMHNKIKWNFDLSNCTLIIHSGDFSNIGEENDLIDFFDWFSKLPCKYKICIAGNHDKSLDEKFWNDKAASNDGHRNKLKGCEVWAPAIVRQFNDVENQHYLQDSECIIEGIKFYGSPWSATFHDEYWAFNTPRLAPITQALYNNIPDDTNVLITHGPAFNNLDLTNTNFRAGCEILDMRIKSIKPKFHLFGHIHEDYGQKTVGDTTYINSSIMNIKYEPINLPQVFEI